VRLVHAAVTGAQIDGYPVTNPVGFRGRHVKISVFNAFAPLVHLGALQTVAQQLELELLEVVAEPYAVARVLANEQVQQSGALFVDIGGGTTDVALVRNGGIEGTRMFALGGRAFTKSIADRLDLPFPRAEELKLDYARGVTVERRAEVGGIVADDVAIWAPVWNWYSMNWPAAIFCRAGSTSAAAVRICPRSVASCGKNRSGGACHSAARRN
jgi:cell division protein FtsA